MSVDPFDDAIVRSKWLDWLEQCLRQRWRVPEPPEPVAAPLVLQQGTFNFSPMMEA
jgi:hypothetical protein